MGPLSRLVCRELGLRCRRSSDGPPIHDFRLYPHPGCATTMTRTPSSSQTTVLGEWRPPPSVAIFQFRSCVPPTRALRNSSTLGPPALPPATPVPHAGSRARKGDLAGNG